MNKIELKKLLQDSIELLENGRNPTEVSNKLLDRTISELPDFKTFLKKELVDDIDTALFYGYNSSTKEALKDSKRAVPVIAENLINDREHIIGNMISPNLDSIYLKKMKEDSFYENVKERIEDEKRLTTFKEDWNDTEELKVAMKSGYEEILSDEVLIKKVEEKIKKLSPFLSEYNVELDFLNQGELKVVSEVKEKEEEVKNMKGYGKEVYITESDDTTERTIKGEKYIIERTSYYDDETGDSSFKIVAKNENGGRVYEYSEYSDFDNYSEECYQDTSVVDNEFLKELNKMTDKKLPTQEEIENKYPELKKEVDKEDSKLQNLKDYLGNAVNVENEIDKFSDKMEVIVDKLNLIDKLPVFKVMTEDGILYSSDKDSVDFQDKDGNMVYERTKLFDEIKDKMGEEFFNNMNMNDIRDWENFKNNSDITLVYDSYGEEGDYRLKEYSDFNSYAKETVKPFLVQEILKNPELGDILKEDIIKDDKVKENNKEIKEKEVIKDDREMDF